MEKLKKKVRVGGCRHMKYCLPMIPCSSNKVLIVALTGGLNPLHPRDFYSELMCLVIIYRVIQQVQSWWQSTVWDFLSIRLLLSVHRYLPFEKYNENNCPADRKPFCSRRTNSSWLFFYCYLRLKQENKPDFVCAKYNVVNVSAAPRQRPSYWHPRPVFHKLDGR